jgi:hypothetical protein
MWLHLSLKGISAGRREGIVVRSRSWEGWAYYSILQKLCENIDWIDAECGEYVSEYSWPIRTQNFLTSGPGQIQDVNIGNRSFENVAEFIYLRTTVTSRTCIHEEIKNSLNLGNCYDSVQSLLSSRLLSKNVKVILSVVLYGRET